MNPPVNDFDFDRLGAAVRASRQNLQFWRTRRREAVRQYVGAHWSESGSREKVPVNLLALYVQVVSQNLIAQNPRVLLSTHERAQKPAVEALQHWANPELERMGAAATYARVVHDALFAVGVSKVALATPADAAASGWGLKAGRAFLARVDLDDLFFDHHARDFGEMAFIGHCFRVPLDVVKDSKLYGKGRKKLEPSEDQPYNQEGDERLAMLGRGQQAGDEEFEDMVDLAEVYLPRHRRVLTFSRDGLLDGEDPLREAGFIGPETGPYEWLGYGVVPGNLMPKAPIQDLVDLHLAYNRGLRKLMRSVDRIKEVTGVAGPAAEDGSRVLEADDGDMIRLDQPERIKQFVSGGQTLQATLAASREFKDLFSYLGGNIDLLGGRSPQAKTASQDAMLNENASKSIASMQEATLGFVSRTVTKLLWYWWKDPLAVQQSHWAVPGLPQIGANLTLYPAGHPDPGALRRQGPMPEIKVDPYSLRHQTPETRLAALNQIVSQIVAPLMPLLAQQGIAFNVHEYLRRVGSYLDLPDLAEILTIQDPLQGNAGGGPAASGAAPGMPAATQRSYVRESVSGRTDQASNKDQVARMLGHDLGGARTNGELQGVS